MFYLFRTDLELSAAETMYPSRLRCVGQGTYPLSEKTSHFFGWVLNGKATLTQTSGNTLSMSESMYFSTPGGVELKSEGQVVLFERFGYRGLSQVGGPAEKEGRLCYIDNCRSTVLVPPARQGDPVFNLLVFPANTKQTMHIHPTVRLGVVIAGTGECLTEDKPPQSLTPGHVFYLPEGHPHCFNSGPKGLTVVAYHPDSDTGPTDDNHPMLNRTYVKK